MVTEGDTSSEPLTTIGGNGVFASALRTALHDNEIDLAVHSLKDLPTQLEPGLTLAAIPRAGGPARRTGRRGTASPWASSRRVRGSAPGAPRREAQLNALGLGLSVVPLRGNVDTRIGKVRSGELDGVVLARAGLARLDRLDEITETLDPLQCLPAPGQGALAIECRAIDGDLVHLLADLDDADTRACVTAERSLLAALEAGCSAPVGALAEVVEGRDGDELSLRSFVGSVDGSAELRRSLVGPVEEPAQLGVRLARLLLDDGAADLARPPDPAEADGSAPSAAADAQPANAPDLSEQHT